MKRSILLFTLLCNTLLLTAQPTQNAGLFDMRLAERFSLNTTSFDDVRQLLGEPVFISQDRTTAQFSNGKLIAMFQFSKGGILTEMLVTSGERKTMPIDYTKTKNTMVKPNRAALMNIFGAPLEIRVNEAGTQWYYKTNNQSLTIQFRADDVQFLYNEQHETQNEFTLAGIDFLVAGKTMLNEVITKLGTPAYLQLNNDGEDRVYKNERLQLRLLVNSSNVVTHFLLEGLNR